MIPLIDLFLKRYKSIEFNATHDTTEELIEFWVKATTVLSLPQMLGLESRIREFDSDMAKLHEINKRFTKDCQAQDLLDQNCKRVKPEDMHKESHGKKI